MPDYHIERGSTARLSRVDGELKVGRNATIQASEGNTIVVAEGAYFDGGADVLSNFECDLLQLEHGGELRVKGDLIVHKLLDVAHSVNTSGLIRAGEIDVGGRIRAGEIHCDGRIRVGGLLDAKDRVEAKYLEVGGRARIGGKVAIQDLNVGGLAEVGGGSILGNIRVGGKFESTAPIEFGNIQVFGQISLPANSKGHRIVTFGKLEADGDLECTEMQLNGRAEIKGKRGDSIQVISSCHSIAVKGEPDKRSNEICCGVVRTNSVRL